MTIYILSMSAEKRTPTGVQQVIHPMLVSAANRDEAFGKAMRRAEEEYPGDEIHLSPPVVLDELLASIEGAS